MELLSQLDVQKPDHVSVITRDNRVTISVTKDGSSVSIGFPLNGQVFDLTPRLPLQQTTTEMKAVKVSTKRKLHRNWLNKAKLRQRGRNNKHLWTQGVRGFPLGNRKLGWFNVFDFNIHRYLLFLVPALVQRELWFWDPRGLAN